MVVPLILSLWVAAPPAGVRAPVLDRNMPCPSGLVFVRAAIAWNGTVATTERWGCMDIDKAVFEGDVIEVSLVGPHCPCAVGIGPTRVNRKHGRWQEYSSEGTLVRVADYADDALLVSFAIAPPVGGDGSVAPNVDAPSRWPVEAIWELGQMVGLLVLLVGAWSFKTRRSPFALMPPLRLPSLRSRALRMVLAAALTTTGGWLLSAKQFGAAQTLAMALGGPSVEEVMRCRVHAQFGEACPYGGARHSTEEGIQCSKHGLFVMPVSAK